MQLSTSSISNQMVLQLVSIWTGQSLCFSSPKILMPPAPLSLLRSPSLAKVKTSLGFLQDMDDSQMETALLRSCLTFPKVGFPLRTCPPHYIHHALEEFDNSIRESLEAILAGTVPAWSWLKASLPSCRGGLGLRNSTLHAPAAFLGSRTQAESLMERILGHPPGPSPHTQLTLASLASATVPPPKTTLLGHWQSRWTEAPLLCPRHPIQGIGSLTWPIPCGWLVKCRSFSFPRPSPPWPWVPQLT